MGEYALIQKDTLTAMGDAVREVHSETRLYTLDEMIARVHPNAMAVQFIERDFTPIFKLPEGLTKIGAGVFYNCTNLALTSLPDSVTHIYGNAFENCTNLALTSLPDSLTIIYPNAFYGCSNLALTSLPEGIRYINSQAFCGCIGLKTITFKGTPNSIANNAFLNCANLTIINVPWAEGEVADAPWGAINAVINYDYTGEQKEA